MSGVNFIELGFRNFQSYGNNLNILALDFKKPTAIYGRNLDMSFEGNIETNAAGKSTILNALAYVLYDQTISGVKKDKLVNWINEKNMEVYVIFEKDKVYYKVERFRKFPKKGGDGIKIYSNTKNKFDADSKDIAQDSIARANKQLVDILGVPFDVFCRVVLLSAATESFYSLPATSAAGKTCQSDILEELFNYTEISKKSDALKKKISKDREELERISDLNKQIVSEHERHNAQIEFTKKELVSWENSNKEEEQKLIETVNKLSEIDYDTEKLIFEQIRKIELSVQEKQLKIKEIQLAVDNQSRMKKLHDSWKDINNQEIEKISKTITEYSKINFSEQESLYDTIENLTTDKINLNETIERDTKRAAELEKSMDKLADEIQHLQDNKCPYCLQEFKNVSDKIKELKKLMLEQNNEVTTLNDKLPKARNALNSLILSIDDWKKKLLFRSREELISKKMETGTLIDRLAEKKKEKNPHVIPKENIDTSVVNSLNAQINDLNVKIFNFKELQKFSSEQELYSCISKLDYNKKLLENLKSKENPYKKTLDSLLGTVLPKNKDNEYNTLKDDIEHEEFLYKLLTKKDSFIRKNLLNKNLPMLNSRLKHYLLKTGLPHRVTISENMTAQITQFGVQIDYDSLSTGQRARIDLATCFAFRDILQKRHEKVNLCMLDEFLDNGLSYVGVGMAIKMIKEVAREEKLPVFVISHRQELISVFDSVVEVEFNNKFSNIVKSDIRFSSKE